MTYLLLALSVLIHAALSKLAARLYRHTQLRWSHALVFALMLCTLLGAGAIASHLVASQMLPFIGMVLGIIIQLSLGGWYFGGRAQTANGEPLGFKRAALLSLITFGLILAIGILAAVAALLIGRVSQA